MHRGWGRVALAILGVAWGANQFVPLLQVYREERHLSEASVTAMFAFYALGLVPVLLIAGSLSDRRGRRAVLCPALVVSLVASLVLIAGSNRPELLYVGRFLAGAATGAALSVGTAWVKELSADAPEGSGARRATIVMSAGFGGGPLAAGAVAQWLPSPTVTPYVLHILLTLIVLPLLWGAPDPYARRGGSQPRSRLVPRAAAHPRFLGVVALWAPWVFATATLGFTTVPSLAGGMPFVLIGAVAGLILLVGICVQPVVRRLGDSGPVVGLLMGAAGIGTAALVAHHHDYLLVLVAGVLLGASYGALMVSGLREVERIAQGHELGALVALYYAVTYVGFGAPYLAANVGPLIGYGWFLLAASLVMIAASAASFIALRSKTVTQERVAVGELLGE